MPSSVQLNLAIQPVDFSNFICDQLCNTKRSCRHCCNNPNMVKILMLIKLAGPKKNFRSKKIKSKILSRKNIGSKSDFGPKNLCKKNLYPENFGPKNFL